eukprot:c12155_g1_i1.p1 GENE.c12155_g1_i1~~c12155_g1_i1.p1  ORF type:complete len:1458 (+),score=411.83 c12155_g1_i1:214-4587(+)
MSGLSQSADENAAQWRERVLAESQRLKSHLLEVKKRRLQQQAEHHAQEQARLALIEGVEPLPSETSTTRSEGSLDSATSAQSEAKRVSFATPSAAQNVVIDAPPQSEPAPEENDTLGDMVDAQIKMLEFAEREVEVVNKRISQLHVQVSYTEDFDEPSPTADPEPEPAAQPLSPIRELSSSSDDQVEVHDTRKTPSASFSEDAEKVWNRLGASTSIQVGSQSISLPETPREQKARDNALVPTPPPWPPAEEATAVAGEKPQDEPKPQSDKQSQPEQPAQDTPTEASATTTKSEEPPKADTEMPVAMPPPRPRAKTDTAAGYDAILSHMQLSSSPLIFFNLACFQGQNPGNIEVTHPICGYSVAGRILAVMGPTGSDTSTLRTALSGGPVEQRDASVLVVDFTVASLLQVAESSIRTSEMTTDKTLIEILGLEEAASVVIGTCIQRGARAASTGAQEDGTPRGSRTPEAPTPRNLNAPTFANSRAGLYKSVLLIEDLSALLKAEDIFKVLKVIRKVCAFERASALVCLNRDFERRGLFKLVDDMVLFTNEGVCYFGPCKGLSLFCRLVGSPYPENTTMHVTDHVMRISNLAAKYHECPIRRQVAQVIEKFTGMKEQDNIPQSITGNTTALTTPRGTIKSLHQGAGTGGKFSKSLLRKSKRQVKEEQIPEALTGGNADTEAVSHAKKLAKVLAEERRKMAEKEASEEKLAVWKQFAELDSKGVKKLRYNTFDQVLMDLQNNASYNKQACFMNLACFIPSDESIGSNIHVIQPTVAFASEGAILGVVSPHGVDATNLMSNLRLGNDSETVTVDLSVRDVIKIAEFATAGGWRKDNNVVDSQQSQEISVQILMAKMMLTASSQEVVGSLVQRRKNGAPQEANIEIGSKTLSMASRSILILDNILALDAQSLYVTLKLIQRVSSLARLAVILVLDKRVEQIGLFNLLDTILIYKREGLFYFGASRHLDDYCRLVDFPCPSTTHVIDHVWNVMEEYSPTTFSGRADDTRTPYSIRYSQSSLGKLNQRIILNATKPQEDDGTKTPRAGMIPKIWGRGSKTPREGAKPEVLPGEEALTAAEEKRQTIFQDKLHIDLLDEKLREADHANEGVWITKGHDSAALLKQPELSLPNGRQSIAEEMSNRQTKPTVFFNLATLLPDAQTERTDVLQTYCGFASAGCITGLMGPASAEVSSLVEALLIDVGDSNDTGPRSNKHRVTVSGLLDIMGDVTLRSRSAKCAGAYVGFHVSHKSASDKDQNILVLETAPLDVPADVWFDLLLVVRQFARNTNLTVMIHLRRPGERRGLFPLLDDMLVFDENGVSFFGPSHRLHDYLVLSGLHPVEGVHAIDHLTDSMKVFMKPDPARAFTNTSPAVRFRYSPLAEVVNINVATFSVSQEPEQSGPTPKRKWSSYLSIKKKSKKRDNNEEETKALQALAESEAEAERQRVAEFKAEQIWRQLASAQSS